MLAIDISVQAQYDIDEIADYTKSKWGWRQAEVYLSRLENSIELLARNPFLGRGCDLIVPGMRRLEVGSHVVFYFSDQTRILIARALHERMLPAKSRFEP